MVKIRPSNDSWLLVLRRGWLYIFLILGTILFSYELFNYDNNEIGSIFEQKSAAGSQTNWPGVAVESVGHPLVKKGKNFVQDARYLMIDLYLNEFLEVYKKRPDTVNLCGIRINHAYALYLTIKVLKPTAIIESGVNAGQSTYFIRAAAPPGAKIYAIDPLEKPICGQKERWIDTANPNSTIYYTGKAFQDISEIDWHAKVKRGELHPKQTLVFLDDHLAVFDRIAIFLKLGFLHVLVEDNYKYGEGATAGDMAGWTPKQMFYRSDADAAFLFNQMVSYAEFPPLVPPIMAKLFPGARKKAGGFLNWQDDNHDIVAPLLRPDLSASDKATYERIMAFLGIDPLLQDGDSYMQVMNYNQFAYFELHPLAPRLVELLQKRNK